MEQVWFMLVKKSRKLPAGFLLRTGRSGRCPRGKGQDLDPAAAENIGQGAVRGAGNRHGESGAIHGVKRRQHRLFAAAERREFAKNQNPPS